MKAGFLISIFLAATVAGAQQTIVVPESWDRLAAKADEVVNVTLDKKMLNFAARFIHADEGDKDPEVAQLISKLTGIYVRTLEFKQDESFVDSDVEPIRVQLRGPEWSQIVHVDSKSDKEKVDIYVRMAGDHTTGMVILSQEPKELAFVDLEGPISPEDLNKLSGNFGIPKNLHGKPKAGSLPVAPGGEAR